LNLAFPVCVAAEARMESCQLLSQILANPMILHALCMKDHWLVADPTFYQPTAFSTSIRTNSSNSVNPLAGSGSWPSLWSTFPQGDMTAPSESRPASVRRVVAHDAATVVGWQALACHCGGTCRSPSRQRIDRISYESGRDRMAVDNGDPGIVPAPVDYRAANARSAGVSHCDRAVATPARIPPRRPSGPRELSRATNSRQGSPQPVHQDARPHGELATDPSVIGGRLARRASPTPRSHRRHEWRTRHGSVQPATDRGSSVAAGA
jgi:hypothetical protein